MTLDMYKCTYIFSMWWCFDPSTTKKIPYQLGRFTLWPKVERPSVSTNQIARNHGFGLSTLHTRGQSPKAVDLQNAYMATLFDQGDGLLRGSLGPTFCKTRHYG